MHRLAKAERSWRPPPPILTADPPQGRITVKLIRSASLRSKHESHRHIRRRCLGRPKSPFTCRVLRSRLGLETDLNHTDDSWVQLRSPSGPTIAFQRAPDHVAPVWPSGTDHLQAHLDFYVDDLDEAEARALAIGAHKSELQPNPESFRVYLDPSGHPFCLCRGFAP